MAAETWQAVAMYLATGHRLIMTCPAFPEQYDLLDRDDRPRAYFRLRRGRYRVQIYALEPRWPGPVVYSREWPNDPYKGMFEDDEREPELLAGIAAAVDWWAANQQFASGDPS